MVNHDFSMLQRSKFLFDVTVNDHSSSLISHRFKMLASLVLIWAFDDQAMISNHPLSRSKIDFTAIEIRFEKENFNSNAKIQRKLEENSRKTRGNLTMMIDYKTGFLFEGREGCSNRTAKMINRFFLKWEVIRDEMRCLVTNQTTMDKLLWNWTCY